MDQNERILELEKRIDELKKELDEHRCNTLSCFASVSDSLKILDDRIKGLAESAGSQKTDPLVS